MPADITGSSVLNMTTSEFPLHQGPIFTDLLLVDEINRMPPRTQAALLEAMEERQVTIDGVPRALSPLFTVVATQNPVEFEGTYPLPEAELDRFAVKIKIELPGRARTKRPSSRGTATAPRASRRCGGRSRRDRRERTWRRRGPRPRGPRRAGRCSATSPTIARRTREWPAMALGASPRAAIHLMQIAKAVAAVEGRDYLLPDDVKRVAPAVLRHRLVIRPEADLEGVTADQVIADVLSTWRSPSDHRRLAPPSAAAAARSRPSRGVRPDLARSAPAAGLLWLGPAWIDRRALPGGRCGTPSSSPCVRSICAGCRRRRC